MLTMKIIKLLGIAGIAVLAAVYMAGRIQRRDEEERRRLNERIEKDRWESEGARAQRPPRQSAVRLLTGSPGPRTPASRARGLRPRNTDSRATARWAPARISRCVPSLVSEKAFTSAPSALGPLH